MQINKLTVKVGTTINLGDYQSVKAEIEIGADLDPREDDGEAFNTLRKKAMEQVIYLLADNHPNKHRAILGGAAPALAAPSNSNGATATAEAAKTRTRRTKEQIAADEAAKARVDAAAEQLGEPAPDALLTGMGGDDSDNLLGDEIPDHPPMTAVECKTIAGQVLKKLGGPSLAKLLTSFGAKDFPSLDAKQYANFAAKAKELIGTA